MTQLNESTVRSRAIRRGYRIRKSRQWKHVPHLDNCREYMLVDFRNWVVLGDKFKCGRLSKRGGVASRTKNRPPVDHFADAVSIKVN